MRNIFWTGYSDQERHATINMIQKVISSYGDIVDFKLFSDLSLAITIETEELKINALYEALKENLGMDPYETIHPNTKNERIIFLNILFGKGTGNLKIEVPAVPG